MNQVALAAEAWPDVTLFQSRGGWTGADSAYSIDLGRRRVLWLFADTFVDPAADGVRQNGKNFFIRNSCAIQTGPDDASAYDPSKASMSFFWGHMPGGVPSSFFHDVDSAQRWVWPLHGARLPDGKLLLFRMQVEASRAAFGFSVLGWDAMAIDDPDQPPSQWVPRLVQPLMAAQHKIVGSSTLIWDGYLYAYTVQNAANDHSVYLARWSLSSLRGLEHGSLSDPEWFCGAGGFRKESQGATPAPLFADGQVELSVHYDARLQRFVEFQMNGLLLNDPKTALGVRWADQPEGPWTKLETFYRPPESALPNVADLVAYAAKAHPEQRGVSVVLTYVVNDLKHMTPSDLLYYPRAVRVRFDGAGEER